MSEALSILASKRIKGSPRSIAALAIYAAARKLGLYISREEVAEAAGVGRTTMRRWKELLGGDRLKPPASMPVELKPWQRKIVISDETLKELPEEVRRETLNDAKTDREKLKQLLQYLYERYKNYRRVALILGLPHATIYYWMLRLGIPVRELPACKSRRLAKVKEVTDEQKVQMWVFAQTDSSVIQYGRVLRVSLSSPNPYLIQYFKEVFETVGDVRVRPGMNGIDYEWFATVYLPMEGYQWLTQPLPRGLFMKNESFWAFIAMLTDTEGSILMRKVSSWIAWEWRVEMQNVELLRLARQGLSKRGVKSSLQICKWKGAQTNMGSYSADLWRLKVYSNNALYIVLREITPRLRIPWKVWLARLALRDFQTQEELIDAVRQIQKIKRFIINRSKQAIKERLAESPPAHASHAK